MEAKVVGGEWEVWCVWGGVGEVKMTARSIGEQSVWCDVWTKVEDDEDQGSTLRGDSQL